VDDAVVAAKVDAYVPWAPYAMVERCAEGPLVYLPYGRSAGAATACYYDPGSRALVSIITGEDTPSACGQSGTASFVYGVYGQYVTCTGLTSIAIDAGSGQ
jgi:hypothetical protein